MTIPNTRESKGPQPIVSIRPSLTPVINPRSIAEIQSIAERASKMLVDVRKFMLAPQPRKEPPVYTGAQVAALCRIDKARLNYLATRGDLPVGTVHERGRSRIFTLEEARIWVDKVGPFVKRPPNTPGKKLSIGNFKGGVGKTSTVMTLAQGLSLYGRKILIVDLDPQASLTTLTGMLADTEVTDEQTILPLVYGEESDLTYAVQTTYWDGIDLIPASSALFGAEFYLPLKQSRDSKFEFWNVLNKGLEPLLDKYDVVIIDTPPALSYLTINAFMASDGLIIPTPPSALDYASSTQFWSLFSDLTSNMKRVVPSLDKTYDFIQVLIAKVEQSHAATPIVRDWIRKTYGDLVMPVEIPMTTVAQSAAAEFGTVYDISKYEGSNKTYQRAREAYDRFAEIIDQQLVTLWTAGRKE